MAEVHNLNTKNSVSNRIKKSSTSDSLFKFKYQVHVLKFTLSTKVEALH